MVKAKPGVCIYGFTSKQSILPLLLSSFTLIPDLSVCPHGQALTISGQRTMHIIMHYFMTLKPNFINLATVLTVHV